MRAYKCAVFALVSFTLAALPAEAQDAKPSKSHRMWRSVPRRHLPSAPPLRSLTSTLSVETDVAYRRGEGRIHALSTNTSLLRFLPRVGESTPYVAAGVGLSQYGAPIFSSNGPPIGTQPRLAMTVNAGGGLEMPMNEKLDLRTDARWFKSFGHQGSEQFRVAQGISFDVGKR
jgi:hypothetical protein